MLFSAQRKLQETAGDTPRQFPVTPVPAEVAATPAPVTDALPTASTALSPVPAPLSPASVVVSPLREKALRQPVIIRGSGKRSAPVVPGAKPKHPLFVAGV